MEAITAYKAKDGTLFEKEEDAIGHDIKGNLELRCNIFYDGFYTDKRLRSFLSRPEIIDIIYQWETYLAQTSPLVDATETIGNLLAKNGDAWLVDMMMKLDVDPALVANALPEEIVLATAVAIGAESGRVSYSRTPSGFNH